MGRFGGPMAVTALLLGAATLLVAILQDLLGVPNPSATYLLAVLVSAALFGTVAGIGASIAAFLLYNFLFVDPRYTFTVAEPGEWLNLMLLLVVGIAVGQLAAALRARAETAISREREARALFQVSRALATRRSTSDVLGPIVDILRREARMERVWIGLSRGGAAERTAADSGGATDIRELPASHYVLRRMPGDAPAQWLRLHQPAARRSAGGGHLAYRVMIDAGGQTLGSVWGLRPLRVGEPGSAETRLLAAAADQLGQTLEQDRLAEEARTAEVARRSDELKSALLESVSHDLKTPLATIRAAAGTILDRRLQMPEDDLAASAGAIDREAEHLNRVVTNLLDLSRIEGGGLRPEVEAMDVDELVTPVLARLRPRLARCELEVALPDGLPPVLVDPVYADQILANILDNAAKYVPDGELVRLTATDADGILRLSVEDSGPGVPADALPRLFEKFYRVTPGTRRSRPGTGVGLAVVRGLAEAMGGRVQAHGSAWGGLRIDVDLPIAPDREPEPEPS